MAKKGVKTAKSSPSTSSTPTSEFISTAKSLLSTLSSSSTISQSTLTSILELKRLSRSSLAALKVKEDKLTEAKKKVESEGLSLQNLLYEKQHLVREIQLAKELQNKNLDTLALAESTSTSSLIPNLSSSKTSTEHTANLDFLAAKLSSRKRLTESLGEAHEEKKKKIAENVTKKEFLSSLPHHLSNLAQAAKPLQQYLSLSSNNLDRSVFSDARNKLTKELYVLFANLSNAGESVAVTPTPKFNPKPYQTYFKSLNKELYNPDEISTLSPSPHSVTLTMTENNASTSITFSFLHSLSVITCSSAAPLSYLFPSDCGTTTPNETNHHKYADHNGRKSVVIPPPEVMVSRPYNWCQWLGGMYFCIGSRQERVEPSVRAILKALQVRVTASKTLEGLLEEVDKASKAKGKNRASAINNLTLHPNCNFIPDTTAVIETFSEEKISPVSEKDEDENVEPTEGDPDAGTISPTLAIAPSTNYRITFCLPNDKSTTLTSTISVSCEYPFKPPTWNITVPPPPSPLDSGNLKALQREVNAEYDNLTNNEDEDGMDYILTHQIKRVAGVFERLANGKESGSIGGVRVRKGKERRKIMAYEKIENE